MQRSSSFRFHPVGSRPVQSSRSGTRGVADFLQANDKLAALMPALSRLAALQQDCAAILPALFEHCLVAQFEAGNLVIVAPNGALATRLKQQLPRLQEGLQKRAWQVSSARIKVQAGKMLEKETKPKQLRLPQQALSSLAALNEALEGSPRNEGLKAALATMLRRHRTSK